MPLTWSDFDSNTSARSNNKLRVRYTLQQMSNTLFSVALTTRFHAQGLRNDLFLFQQVVRRHTTWLPSPGSIITPLLTFLRHIILRCLLQLCPVRHASAQASPIEFQRRDRVSDPDPACPFCVPLHDLYFLQFRGQASLICDFPDHNACEEHTGLDQRDLQRLVFPAMLTRIVRVKPVSHMVTNAAAAFDLVLRSEHQCPVIGIGILSSSSVKSNV